MDTNNPNSNSLPPTTASPPTPTASPPTTASLSTTTPTTTTAPRATDNPFVPTESARWSIVNALISVVGVISVVAAALFVLLLRNKSDTQKSKKTVGADERIMKKGLWWLLTAVILAIVSVAVFLLTQDLSLPFGWIVDKWTIVHIVVLVVEIIAIHACIQENKRAMPSQQKN
jgi:uncharacterized membrane protein